MILVYTQQEVENSKGGGDADNVGHARDFSLQLRQDAISVTFFNLGNSLVIEVDQHLSALVLLVNKVQNNYILLLMASVLWLSFFAKKLLLGDGGA